MANCSTGHAALLVGAGFALGYLAHMKLAREKEDGDSSCEGVSDCDVESDEEYKLVLCVRQDLGMGKGKIAAQCSHASLGIYQELEERNPEVLKKWEIKGQAKVVVKIPNEEAMTELRASAKAKKVPSYVVRDAGRTQIASGSKTVIAIGPGPVSAVDEVSGHLKLL